MTAHITFDWFYRFTPYEGFCLRIRPEYVMAKGESLGHRNLEILELGPTDEPGYIYRSVTRKQVDVVLPPWAKRLIKPSNKVTQIERWRPEHSDGTRIFDLTVKIAGVPVTIQGQGVLVPTGIIGCRYDVRATVRSRVPIIGPKIEEFVADQLRHTMEGEGEFAGTWLTSGY